MADSSNRVRSSLIIQAAQSAAQADGLLSDSTLQAVVQQQQALANARMAAVQNARALQQQQQQQQLAAASKNTNKKGPPLRRGKWTPEEEAYANRLIQEFKAGLLPLTDGTTLRTFLSKLLNCDPMRISKKFVGSNCIGKQVFRRRTADLNRLTPEQIQKSRAELSELERRFLERVAQTNRVKSSGVGSGGGGGGGSSGQAATTTTTSTTTSSLPTATIPAAGLVGALSDSITQQQQELSSPPWLQPPAGYRHGEGAALAAANLSGASSSRAAAAGRALLSGLASGSKVGLSGSMGASGGLLAELQRRASQQSLLQTLQQQQQQQHQSSASNFLAEAVRSGSIGGGSSSLSMAQLARSASAARLAGLTGGSSSVNELMLKTGLSRDQLSQLARERSGLSSGSLSNMIQRQNSIDALMSLDFQSIQSIDNLANLFQTGGGGGAHVPESGIRNADFGATSTSSSPSPSRSKLTGSAASPPASSEDLSQAARRLASAGRMESLLRNLSTNTVRDGIGSNANLSNLLQSMQGNLNSLGAGGSTASLLGGQSAINLANLLRQDSSTGLTALRMQDGLTTQRNSSVDDFLSLVAAGDIPHQDPSLLNVPLMQQQQQQQGGDAAKLLAQHGLLQQSNPALASALGSLGGGLSSLAAGQTSSSSHKRKLDELSGLLEQQENAKR